MPGVGMCAPMRYTASSARVNNTLFRKSGMRKRFRNASMNRFILLPSAQGILQLALAFASYVIPQKRQRDCRTPTKSSYNLERAAGFRDLFLGGRAERMRMNRNLCGQLAIAQNLYAIAAAANESVRAQQLRRYGFAGRKNVQFVQVQDGILDAEQVMKAALGHAAMQRHLAAFKSAAARIAATGLLSFVTGTGSLAELRAYAAAHAHLAVTRTDRRTKIREARESERARSRFAGRFAAAAGFLGRLAAFGNFFRHFPIPPLPRGGALYGSCRALTACPRARPPDAFCAIQVHEWSAACHRCN